MATPREWAERGGFSYSMADPPFEPSKYLFGVDFDSTLEPYRKRGFPRVRTQNLLRCLSRFFNVVIFTNCKRLDVLREYVGELDEAGVSVSVFVGHAGRYRKPHTGLFEAYRELVGSPADPQGAPRDIPRGAPLSPADLEYVAAFEEFAGMYCGDAAGRPGDWSDSDLAFALNCGLQFLTPERLFLGRRAEPIALRTPRLLTSPGEGHPSGEGAPAHSAPGFPPNRPVLVVMVGAPGGGKTTVANALAASARLPVMGGDRGDKAAAILAAISSGRSLVVDGTNPSAEARAALLRAKTRQYAVCIHVATPREVCRHLAAARVQLGGREVPAVAHAVYWKRFEAPTVDEGFDEVVELPFSLRADAPREVTNFHYGV